MRGVAGRPLASTRNSPSIPATRGPSPGGSRRGLLDPLVNERRRGSAASVDSQTPVDPRYAGPLAGWLAPLVISLPGSDFAAEDPIRPSGVHENDRQQKQGADQQE